MRDSPTAAAADGGGDTSAIPPTNEHLINLIHHAISLSGAFIKRVDRSTEEHSLMGMRISTATLLWTWQLAAIDDALRQWLRKMFSILSVGDNRKHYSS